MVEFVVIACFSFPLSGPASDHQFSVEENETSFSGKIHHHHRRHTHSQDTLCHSHTKNSEYLQSGDEPSKLSVCKSVMCLDCTLMLFSCSWLYVAQHPVFCLWVSLSKSIIYKPYFPSLWMGSTFLSQVFP